MPDHYRRSRCSVAGKTVVFHIYYFIVLMKDHDWWWLIPWSVLLSSRCTKHHDHPCFDRPMIEQITLLAGVHDIPTMTEHTRSSKTWRQEPQDIVEGFWSGGQAPARFGWTLMRFCDTDDDVRIIRRISDMRAWLQPDSYWLYLGVVKPMYHQFIEPTKRYADIAFLRQQWLLTIG